MEYADIRIGTILELNFPDEDGNPAKNPLASRFEEMEQDGGLIILAPMQDGAFLPLHPGTMMVVIFEHKGEQYGFHAMVRNRHREGELRFISIWPDSELEQVQRRGFYRFLSVEPCRYRILPEGMDKNGTSGMWQVSLTRDISGGGLGLLFEDKPELGMNIEGILDLAGEVRFFGEIVRIEPIEEQTAYRFEAGISFREISNHDREFLISHIYQAQRNLLKKGWTGIW